MERRGVVSKQETGLGRAGLGKKLGRLRSGNKDR